MDDRAAFTRRDALKAMSLLTLAAAGVGNAMQSQPVASSMIQRSIPSTGEKIPVIGLGTWQTFDVGADEKGRAPLRDVLKAFAELGGTVIDSSPMYGKSEQVAGDLSRELQLQGKLFIATKVWTRGREEGIAQMENSIRQLQTKTIDLMQVHNLVDVDTHLATLRAWKESGKIRYIGVTHYTASAHDAVAQIVKREKLDFLQINYSVTESEAEDSLLPLARDRGVAVIANRPLAGGAVLRKLQNKPLPAFAPDIGCQSWAQLFLKFVISHTAITCAIPATSKVSHLTENMAAGTGAMPDVKTRKAIRDAARA